MKNQELAGILYEIGAYLEMEGAQFKPRAYEKAAHSVESLEKDVTELYREGGMKALEDIPGVGASIAEKIEEFLKTGKVTYYESLKKKYPVSVGELSQIEGVGPKMALEFYKKLKVKNINDLERAAKAGRIAKLEGFGKKSEENILKGIAFLRKSGGRFVLGFVLPHIREIEKGLASRKEVERIVIAGSVRRWKETIGDLDILVISKKPKSVMDAFISMPGVINVYAHGKTKSAVRLEIGGMPASAKASAGIDADLRVVPPESFGAALNYFTGSKDHNVALREIAIKKGYKLNEYGLFKGKKQIAGKTEEEIYKALGLSYIEPEIRENTGEIEASLRQAQGKQPGLPKLIGYNDVRGDLQTQTDWTDGAHSIKEMALEARKLGHEYIAITDHTKSLAMTGGSDERKLLRQMAEIDKLNRQLGGRPKILKGAEVNIMKDGSLDIRDSVLAKLDVVGVAVHSNFNMTRKDMTERIKKAMANPHVDILFHPTGRVVNQRPAYELDMEDTLRHAKKTGTIVEVDAYPDRLDLKDEHVRMAVNLGAKLSIDTDAHATQHLSYMELGIAQARRGWAEKKDVINTRPLDEMLGLLKRPHP